MTLWRVEKYYDNQDNIKYMVSPYSMKGHLSCCLRWYGFNGLKNCYLFRKQAERKAHKLSSIGG